MTTGTPQVMLLPTDCVQLLSAFVESAEKVLKHV